MRPSDEGSRPAGSPLTTALHVVSYIPVPSKDISIDLARRDQVHWQLVRTIVCTLWRSKLVSSGKTSHHTNSLRLVFPDGVTIHLQEDEFVTALAKQHQAAPCEFQILSALIERIKQYKHEPEAITSRKKRAKQILKDIIHKSPESINCVMLQDHSAPSRLAQHFYEAANGTPPTKSVVYFLDLCSDKSGDEGKKWKRDFIAACAKLSIPSFSENLCQSICRDHCAMSFVMLQHFCYQNRLFRSDVDKNQLKRKRT